MLDISPWKSDINLFQRESIFRGYNKTMDQKNVLITGAVGNVGMACATNAANSFWNVYTITRETNDPSMLDLTNWDDTVDWVEEYVPNLDLVIMSHGVQKTTTLELMTEHCWDHVIDNNLMSCASLISALIWHKRIKKGALLILFSSIQATQPRVGRAAYAAAKAGVEGLARATAVEVGELFGARAISLRIGQMTKSMKGIDFTPEQMEQIKENIPLSLVTPEEIAKLCFDLYDLKSITGDSIEITSGHTYNIW